MMKKTMSVLFMLLLAVVGFSEDPQFTSDTQTPPDLHDGLSVGSPRDAGIDIALMQNALDRIRGGAFGEVHSLLIYRGGSLVWESYFPGHRYFWEGVHHHGIVADWDSSMRHSMLSVSKSITSTCIGIAIDRGFIASGDQSIFDYLPDYQNLKRDGREDISIEHLLTMTSGLEWDEWSTSPDGVENDIVGIWLAPDPVAFVLGRPLKSEPGTRFTYSGGNMIVLGEILKNATGMNIDEFSRQYLFEPLGITSAVWSQRFANGVFEAAGGLKITPRDMVKIGSVFLNDGRWNQEQIISSGWVEKSSRPYRNNRRINIPGSVSGLSGYLSNICFSSAEIEP